MEILNWHAVYFTIISLFLLLRCITDCWRRRPNTDVQSQQLPPNQTRRHNHQHDPDHQVGSGPFSYLSVHTPAINAQRPPPLPRVDEGRINEIAEACTECVICLGEYAEDGCGVSHRTLTPCGHRFHQLCIDPWLEKTQHRRCPICRAVTLDDSSVLVQGINQHSLTLNG